MLNLVDVHAAICTQQAAARRHLWAQRVMDEAEYYLHTPNGGPTVSEFIWWSKERAEYTKNAMAWMGITEEDQYYS